MNNSRAFYTISNCSSRGHSVVVTRQVVPIDTSVQGKNYSEIIQYSRIRIETLNQDTLRKAFERVNDKYPSVIDLGNHYGYQYCNKPSIFISKIDGRIYGEKDDHLTRLQAIFCLQKLNKFGLVEGFKRIQKHPRNRTIPFLEETEGKEKKVEHSTIKNGSPFIFSNFTPSASERKVNER